MSARLVFGVTEPPATADHRPYAFVAWDGAGHVREVLADSGRDADVHVAAGWALTGLTVERMPVDDGLPTVQPCGCPVADQPGLGL